MRMRWKLIGLAGIAGVAATGAVVARNRRVHASYDPDALRDRLHERLAEAAATNGNGTHLPELSEDVPPPA
jgi:predicted dehydrogenase